MSYSIKRVSKAIHSFDIKSCLLWLCFPIKVRWCALSLYFMLQYASNGLVICVKSSRHLRQIARSFDAVCGATYFILFHVLTVSSKMLTPFKIL